MTRLALLDDDTLAQEIERRRAASEQQDVWAEISFHRETDRIGFRVEDRGPGFGFDWRGFLDVAPDRVFDSHGRGIAMARHLAFDSLPYEGAGIVVMTSVKLAPDAPAE